MQLPPFVEQVDWITLWTFDLYAILDDDNEALVSCTGAFEIDDDDDDGGDDEDDALLRTIDIWFDDDAEVSQRITSLGSA